MSSAPHLRSGDIARGLVGDAAGDPDGGQRGDGADSHEAEAAVTGVS
ncbi:hypothetical protein [Streptomyces sp. c-19]